jgi:hypothetical protein
MSVTALSCYWWSTLRLYMHMQSYHALWHVRAAAAQPTRESVTCLQTSTMSKHTHLEVCHCMQVCWLEVPETPVPAAVLHYTAAHQTSVGCRFSLQDHASTMSCEEQQVLYVTSAAYSACTSLATPTAASSRHRVDASDAGQLRLRR